MIKLVQNLEVLIDAVDEVIFDLYHWYIEPQNNANRQNVKGYGFVLGKWHAAVKCNYKSHYVGRFDTEEEARAAYLTKKLELFGEFAR